MGMLRGKRGDLLDEQKEAMQQPPMRRFAYLVLPLVNTGTAQYNLNNMGVEGWELVAVNGKDAIMKREYEAVA